MTNNENNPQKSDVELVALTLESQKNFIFIIKRYERKLLRYILRISNLPPEDAEDLLQEVFIKVYYHLRDFDKDLKFSSWIYRITHNQVISNYRKLKARPQSAFWEIEEEVINNIASKMNIEQEVDLELLRKNIYQILNILEKKYKEVLILRFLEEKNYQEISDILKKPMGTVATLINKGKKKFKFELSKQDIKLK